MKDPAYEQSILDFPAPEYVTGEVILGSTYRQLLVATHDASIDLQGIANMPQTLSQVQGSPPEDVWRHVLLGVGGLASPQPSGRHGSPLPQLMPLVPQIGNHACVLGRPRGRANPGNLVVTTLLAGHGCPASGSFDHLVEELRDALMVQPNDDAFGRFVEAHLSSMSGAIPTRPQGISPESSKYVAAYGTGYLGYSPPAAQFRDDLRRILLLKGVLTRRQWTILVETFLRLGIGMHLLWACRANDEIWKMSLDVARGEGVPTTEVIRQKIWTDPTTTDPLLEVGRPAGPAIRRRLGRYAAGRIGLNLLLGELRSRGYPLAKPIGLKPPPGEGPWTSVWEMLTHLQSNIGNLPPNPADWLQQEVGGLTSTPRGLLEGTAGFNRNMNFFLIYGLGQLTPFDPAFTGYDQSYTLAKKVGAEGEEGRSSTKGRRDASPWVVRFGPSALIGLVHSCCRSRPGYAASIDDFRLHLAQYGLLADFSELESGQLASDLKRLGLTVESPDAAGGRLLQDPFPDV